ncbi:recombinase family protein [Gluconobacter cerinus]
MFGSTSIAQRRGFARLINRLEAGDILIVTKLDRLGRDAMDVSITVKMLGAMGVKVYCLALGGADLTSSSGTMTMQVLNAVAQFERDLLIERTQSGLRRAKSEGKTLGRPSTLSAGEKQSVLKHLAEGISVSALARKFSTSMQTIMRVRSEGFLPGSV